MPFSLDPEVAAALVKLFGSEPAPPLAIGDWQTRRRNATVSFSLLKDLQPAVTDVEVQDFHTKSEDGHHLLCRWITKKTDVPMVDSPAVYYTHGGGMIALDLNAYNHIIKRYVSRTGVPFMTAEYRLVPEVHAPVPLQDVYAGFEYLHSHARELGVDPERIAIMGDSAGGGLTASLAHYLKMKGGPSVSKVILIYPMLDDRTIGPEEEIEKFATWSFDDNKTAWAAYLGEDRPGSDDVGLIEAAGRMTVDDARGLPPTYIDVGELDIFRDEDLEYARTLGKAGVSCEVHVVPGIPHGAELYAPDSRVGQYVLGLRERVIESL